MLTFIMPFYPFYFLLFHFYCRQMYYRQKGQRNPTRPQAIHENFDLCAEALGQRLISYRKQSEEYHNSCIQGELKNKKEKT